MTTFLRSSRFRRGSWLVIVALVLVSLVRNTVDDGGPGTAEDRVRSIASTMKCPVCRSQSVADSDVAAAQAIRGDIARRVSAGESDDEIRDAIAEAYGDDLQLIPRSSGLPGLVWILPVVALVVALAALSAVFARWRRTAATAASDDDRAVVAQALRER